MATDPTCPICDRPMYEVDSQRHGYTETHLICEPCDLVLAEDSYKALNRGAEA